MQMNTSDLMHVEYGCMQCVCKCLGVCLQNFSPFDQFLPTVPSSLVAQVVPIDDNTNMWLKKTTTRHLSLYQISYNKHKNRTSLANVDCVWVRHVSKPSVQFGSDCNDGATNFPSKTLMRCHECVIISTCMNNVCSLVSLNPAQTIAMI